MHKCVAEVFLQQSLKCTQADVQEHETRDDRITAVSLHAMQTTHYTKIPIVIPQT